MTRPTSSPYCTATPGCIYQAVHKGECYVRDDSFEDEREVAS